MIVGTACTAGNDDQLARLVGIAKDIAREEKLSFKLAAIHCEQDKGYLKQKLREGKITPLANAPEISAAVIDRSAHIVGMCGIEPYIEALQNGAEVIIALSAVPLIPDEPGKEAKNRPKDPPVLKSARLVEAPPFGTGSAPVARPPDEPKAR